MATRIPINKESSLGFDDRQKKIWKDMETDMDRRRREWEEEIEKMRKEFFMFRPEDEHLGGGVGPGTAIPMGMGQPMGPRSRLLETTSPAEDSRGMVVKDDKGNPVFKVLFDVHDYKPEEVAVKMDDNRVVVSARHDAQAGGSSVSREYSRRVSIPANIDPLALQCTMGPDGILAVEAPIPAPSYTAVTDTETSLPIHTASTGSSSSSAPAQKSSSTTSSTYKTSYQHGADPSYPAGYRPVAPQPQNSAPPAAAGSSSVGGGQPTSSSAPGMPKASPPFQAMASQQAAPAFSPPPAKPGTGAGRIGSPVVLADPGKFKVEIDIEDFKPEELTVKTQEQRVMVCAKREEKVGTSTRSRELSRERSLPESVDPLTIKAFFTDGGKLIIEAPYREGTSSVQVTSR